MRNACRVSAAVRVRERAAIHYSDCGLPKRVLEQRAELVVHAQQSLQDRVK